jgi:hypothetical protein
MRHSLRTASLGLLLLGGCRERAPVPPSPVVAVEAGAVWPEAPAEGFVVLPWGTRVYLEPRFGGASARLGWPNPSPPPWPTTGHVARVVGQRDGFVEIAPLSLVTEAHCGPVLDGEAFDVRLFVSPWSLAPVLTREVDVVHDDGSVLSLRPGAVVQPIPDDPRRRWAIAAAGIRVRAVLPDDAVGLAYAAPEPLTMPAQRTWQTPEGRVFSYDGWPLELDHAFGHDVAVAAVEPLSEGFRVELMSPCARVLAQAAMAPPMWQAEFPHHFEGAEFGLVGPEVVVPRVLLASGRLEPVVEPEPPLEEPVQVEELVQVMESGLIGSLEGEFSGMGLLASALARPERVFEEGAPVYLSAAGPAAGTLSQMRVFSEDGWAVGDRLCFHTSFGSRFDPALAVCLDASEGRLRDPAVDVHDFGIGVVRPVSIRTTGALPELAVARALRMQRPDLRRCHNDTLQRGVQSDGELELALDVSGRGAVEHVQLRSLRIDTLSDCVLAAARAWELPPTDDGKPARIVLTVRLERR